LANTALCSQHDALVQAAPVEPPPEPPEEIAPVVPPLEPPDEIAPVVPPLEPPDEIAPVVPPLEPPELAVEEAGGVAPVEPDAEVPPDVEAAVDAPPELPPATTWQKPSVPQLWSSGHPPPPGGHGMGPAGPLGTLRQLASATASAADRALTT
jgi:hypothetical protein